MIIIFEHSPFGPACRIASVLAEFGRELDIRHLHAEDRIPSPDVLQEVEAVISLGGSMNVEPDDLEQYSWMREEMEFIRQAHEMEVPLVGVCLGGQLIAAALGGEVGRLDSEAAEIGWHGIQLTTQGIEDVVFNGQPPLQHQFHWHTRCVKQLPPDAVPLAASTMTDIQAFRVGNRSYGFQFHFEVDRALIKQWSHDHPDQRSAVGLTHEELMSQTDQYYEDYDRHSRLLCRSIDEYLVSRPA